MHISVMASTEADEDLARKLQEQYDKEAAIFLQMGDKAASSHGAHQISDSDSDETIDPADINFSLDGSQDLFETNDNAETFTKCNRNILGSPQKISCSQVKKQKKTHEISSSESGSDDDKHTSPNSAPNSKPDIVKLSQIPLTKPLVFENDSKNCCLSPTSDHPFDSGKNKKLGKRKAPQEQLDRKSDVSHKKVKQNFEQKKNSHMVQKSIQRASNKEGKTFADVFIEFQPVSLFLSKVTGIDDRFNNIGAASIKDILSPCMGHLQASCQFNFMFDIPWLVRQYPKEFRDRPILLVHGEQGHSETEMKRDASQFPNISLCRAKLEIMYGTHHTKMMLLLYDKGMRVVIHTANLIEDDWYQKTQGIWISPLFPKLTADDERKASGATLAGDSPTKFKQDLLEYLNAYSAVPLTAWEQHIQQHNMASASVYLIASVPGRHSGKNKMSWGHMKLRKVLQEEGPDSEQMKSWSVIGQFSSIGSLGSSPDQWLCAEWLSSLSQCQRSPSNPIQSDMLQLVYPSKENVRLCLEGYSGGGCLPYSIKTAQKQIYLNTFVRKWASDGRGRTKAIPHIKTYVRVSSDYKQAAWFIVTSANLSKAAWGALEKQKTQLMIRSYEIGVLFLPRHFGNCRTFPIGQTAEEVRDSSHVVLPFPYDLPPPRYQKGDRIWMWDVPCVDLPDTHGKKYCPRL